MAEWVKRLLTDHIQSVPGSREHSWQSVFIHGQKDECAIIAIQMSA